MKIFRLVGAVFMASLFFSVSLASSSAITDLNAGMASDVVRSHNIIQVYHYDGVSSEAGLMGSTFNQGEQWTNTFLRYSGWGAPLVRSYVKPVSRLTTILFTRQSEAANTRSMTSDYVKTIDACKAAGNFWNYKNDTCI
jgi:hypothetical protein